MIKLRINTAVAPGDVISYNYNHRTCFATVLSSRRLSTWHYAITAAPIHRRLSIPSYQQ